MLRHISIPLLLVQSFALLLRERRLLTCLLAPMLYSGLILLLSFAGFWSPLAGSSEAIIHWLPSWLQFGILEFLMHLIIVSIAATLTTSLVFLIIFSLYLERFIHITMTLCDLPVPQTQRSLVQSVFFGLKEDSKQIVVFSILGLLFLICAFVPLLAPINLLGSACLLGLKTLDVPCSVLMLPFELRWKLARKHFVFLVVLGAIHLLFLAIPFVGFLIAPVFYIAIIRYVGSTQERETFIHMLEESSLRDRTPELSQ